MADKRKDQRGEFRLMAEAEGYVMVRRPHAMPIIKTAKEWAAMQTPQQYDEIKSTWEKHMTPARLPFPSSLTRES